MEKCFSRKVIQLHGVQTSMRFDDGAGERALGKILQFQRGAEKRVRVSEDVSESSLFYPAYQQAFAAVVEIVDESARCTERDYAGSASGSNETGFKDLTRLIREDKYLYNYPNNMIAFSGGRGTGKSSAMLTFVQALQDRNSFAYKSSFIDQVVCRELPGFNSYDVEKLIDSTEFVSLSPIDPTLMGEGDEILNVILSRMYQMASDAWDCGKRGLRRNYWESDEPSFDGSLDADLNQKNCLLERFSACFEHVSAIKQMERGSYRLQGLDSLGELGDAAKLKCELARLVENLLRFCTLGSSRRSFLVIQIDDTDMNIKQAYAILEDLRKYLMIPRVIIVMAANLAHLKRVVESTLLSDYENRLGNSACKLASDIASQYITKLFPQSRHIRLPNLNSYLRDRVDDVDVSYLVNGEDLLLSEGMGNTVASSDMQKKVLALIYRKTGLIFLRRENQLHRIIPGNMRLLAHFLSMLVSMADVEPDTSKKPRYFGGELENEQAVADHIDLLNLRAGNIARFTDYFLETWLQNNLTEGDADVIRQLSRLDREQKVKFACRSIVDKLAGEGDVGKPNPDDYYGYDYLVMLYELSEKLLCDERDFCFIFAIQTYFSLLAHSIVVDRLIGFYSEAKAKSLYSDSECEFSSLWPIFGSHMFPYESITNLNDIRLSLHSELLLDNQSLYVVDSQDIFRRVPIRGRRCLGEDFDGVLGFACREPMRPLTDEAKESQVAGEKESLTDEIKKFFISCFADYADAEDCRDLVFDALTPIVNSLYLYTVCESDEGIGVPGWLIQFSPTCRSLFAGNKLSGKESKIKILAPDWQQGRETALLVVLNWDLQAEVVNRLKEARISPRIVCDNNGIRDRLTRLYKDLSDKYMQPECSGKAVLDDYVFLESLSLPHLLSGMAFGFDQAGKEGLGVSPSEMNPIYNSLINEVFCPASEVLSSTPSAVEAQPINKDADSPLGQD